MTTDLRESVLVYVDRFLEEQAAVIHAKARLAAAQEENSKAAGALAHQEQAATIAFGDLCRAIEAATKGPR